MAAGAAFILMNLRKGERIITVQFGIYDVELHPFILLHNSQLDDKSVLLIHSVNVVSSIELYWAGAGREATL